jgi:hypothetical protein
MSDVDLEITGRITSLPGHNLKPAMFEFMSRGLQTGDEVRTQGCQSDIFIRR